VHIFSLPSIVAHFPVFLKVAQTGICGFEGYFDMVAYASPANDEE